MADLPAPPDTSDPQEPRSPTQAARPVKKAAKKPRGIVFYAMCFFGLLIAGVNVAPLFDDQKPTGGQDVKEGEFRLPLNNSEQVTKDLTQVSVQVDGLAKQLEEQTKESRRTLNELTALRRRIEETTAVGGAQAAGEELTKELATFPDGLRAEFSAAVAFLDNHALTTGVFDPLDALPTFQPWLRARNQTATDEQIRALCLAARVRRKTLTDEQYQLVPRIAAKRAALGIPKDRVFAIAKLIWQQRDKMPPISAGQILSLATLAGQTTADVAPAEGQEEPGLISAKGAAPNGSPWSQAVAGQLPLPASVAFGGLTITPSELRQALHATLPEIAAAVGRGLSTPNGGQAIAYAEMLVDGRVNQLLAAGASPLLHLGILEAIRRDLGDGAKIALAFELTNEAVSGLTVQQSTALRAAIIGTAAGRAVAAAAEPVLDLGLLPGLLSQPSGELLRVVAGMKDEDDGSGFLEVVDRAARLGGPSPVTSAVIAARRQTRQSGEPIAAVMQALAAAQVPAAALRQIEPLLPVAVALANGRDVAVGQASDASANVARAIGRFATATGSQAAVVDAAEMVLIPRYRRDYPTLNLDWSAIHADIMIQAATTSQDALQRQLIPVKGPADVAPGIAIIKQSAAIQAEATIIKAIVRQVVQSAIAQASIGRDRLLLDGVRLYIDQRLDTLVVPDFSDDKIRSIAASVSREATAILTGRRELPNASRSVRAAKPVETQGAARAAATGGGDIEAQLGVSGRVAEGPARGGSQAGSAPTGVYGFERYDPNASAATASGQARPAIPLAGPAAGRRRSVVIQSGSYGQAYIYSGVEVAPTGVKRRITFNLTHSLKGTGTRPLVLKNMRLIGEAYACPNSTTRLYVDLKTCSIEFPSGLVVERDCDGYVNDHAVGVDGIIGHYKLNLDEVGLPLTMAGLLQGAGIGLNAAANTSTTSVTINNGTTATETNPPNTAKAVAAGAITGATNPMVDYLHRAAGPIGPTIQVENGQPVTVILAKPVVFDGVPDAEWRSLEGGVDGNSLFK